MPVRRCKAVGLRYKEHRSIPPPPISAGRVRSVRPPKLKVLGAQVTDATTKGKALLLGDVPVNGHHVATELAGAWAAAHRLLHDEDPIEATVEWTAIVSAARRVFVEYLKGDFEEALDLIRWSLERRNKNRDDGRRFTWKSVFNASNVTDFKVSRRR